MKSMKSTGPWGIDLGAESGGSVGATVRGRVLVNGLVLARAWGEGGALGELRRRLRASGAAAVG